MTAPILVRFFPLEAPFMLFKVIAVALVTFLLHGSLLAETQPLAKMQQVLRKAQEKNKAVKITLAKELDNQAQLRGTVSEVSDTGFAVTDKTGKITKLAYGDVQQVKQEGTKGWVIALVVAAGVGALVAALVFASIAKNG